jgi:1,4-dihydroxy-2-naphthoyl-CoA hydrolase
MKESIWKLPVNLDVLNELSQNTLVSHLGISFTACGEDYLVATMPVDERTCQPMGLLHGGASVSLAETLGSVASTLCLADYPREVPVGLEINANHLRAVKSGLVTGKATAIKIGRNVHVWQIEILDESGRLCCLSRLTTSILRQDKAE